MDISRPLTVMLYEWRRSIASRRFISWIFLVGFPVVIVALVEYAGQGRQSPLPLARWSETLFYLIPCVCCLLSLLLTSAPYLQAELEGRTWTYMAIRPGVKTAVLHGKYLYAVGRTVITVLVALIICLLISNHIAETQLLWTMVGLVVLSSLAYGAVFVFIGTVAPRRAMVVAVVYAVFEFGIGQIPVVVNQFTVQYRLRSLLLGWMDWDTPNAGPLAETLAKADLFSTQPWWQHVLIMLLFSGGLLVMAQLILNRREFSTTRDE